jgi:hypothetical protein
MSTVISNDSGILPRVETATYSLRNRDDDFGRLVRRIRPFQENLVTHLIYTRVRTLAGLRVFMKNHVFAVWDFMSLAKALQQEITCVQVPWIPVADENSARLINEIVLGEETDEVPGGGYMSHYTLYLKAMDEIGADKGPILAFEKALREGIPVEQALAPLDIAENTKLFVLSTLKTALEGRSHEIAASLMLAREDLIPTMFDRVLKEMDARAASGVRAVKAMRSLDEKLPSSLRRALAGFRPVARAFASKHPDPREFFRLYLARHVYLDGEEHGPMGQELVTQLCGDDGDKWQEATDTSRTALKARIDMWDGVLDLIATEAEMVGGYRSGWGGQVDGAAAADGVAARRGGWNSSGAEERA